MNNKDELIRKIFNTFNRLKRAAGSNSIVEMGNDIRPSEEMLLLEIDILSHGENVKVSDLVSTLKFAPSTISTILKALEDSNYIIRSANVDNRREVFVKVTDKGKLRVEAAKKSHFNLVEDLITHLGENDTTKLIEILEKITCFFEEKKKMKGKDENDKIN